MAPVPGMLPTMQQHQQPPQLEKEIDDPRSHMEYEPPPPPQQHLQPQQLPPLVPPPPQLQMPTHQEHMEAVADTPSMLEPSTAPSSQEMDMDREHDLDSQPSELGSQEEEPQDDQDDSRMDADFGAPASPEEVEPDRGEDSSEMRIDSQPNTADTEDRDGCCSDEKEEEPETDRYADTEEADIEDAEDDAEQERDNSPPAPSPAVISPIGEPPISPDRCSSNSDPPMLTAELPTESSLNTSVFNFTEDEEPPPPLHMSMNGSPRKIKMPR